MVYNSAVECSFDKREVTGSNPVRPKSLRIINSGILNILKQTMIFLSDNKSLFLFASKLSSIFPKFIRSIVVEEPSKNFHQLSLELFSQKDIIPVLNFLKHHSNSLFLSIAEITVVD